MSKDESKRVNPSDAQEISDETLEKVAGGGVGNIPFAVIYPDPIDPIFKTTVVIIDPDPAPIVQIDPSAIGQ